MNHSFNTDIAQEIGVIPAIMLEHIAFWVLKNKANQTNEKDGKYWTFATKEGFQSYFPYLTTKQIRYALDKLESEKYLAEWTPKRIAHIAVTQGSLLASAVDALKIGGQMIYSTCALSKMENDDVVRKILKKRKGRVHVLELKPEISGTDVTEFGVQMLPDKCAGRGPIYCAKLEKIA